MCSRLGRGNFTKKKKIKIPGNSVTIIDLDLCVMHSYRPVYKYIPLDSTPILVSSIHIIHIPNVPIITPAIKHHYNAVTNIKS
jgi:hypothetical protein